MAKKDNSKSDQFNWKHFASRALKNWWKIHTNKLHTTQLITVVLIKT